jgi:hypothetical protein
MSKRQRVEWPAMSKRQRVEWPAMSKRQRVEWLPRMDSNHDKAIQSRLCYRYTTRQCQLNEPIRYRKTDRCQLPNGVETFVPGGGENSKVDAGSVSRRTFE